MHKALRPRQILTLCVLYFLIYEYAIPALLANGIYPKFGMQAYLLCSELSEAFVIVLAFMICFGWLYRQWQRFRGRMAKNLTDILSGVGMMFLCALALQLLVFSFFGMSEAENQISNDAMMNLDLPAFVFSACIFAPFMEELIFRGCIFQPLRNKFGFVTGALASALAFGSVHIIASAAAGNWINLLYIFEYGLCGFILCWCMERSGSVYVNMAAHAVYNLIIILFL